MTQIIEQQFKMVEIDSIQPHPENPRKGDRERIGESIKANKFYGACIVQQSTGYIVAGSHRWMELKEQGATHCPIIEIVADDATALRILLADNRTNDAASYDDDILTALLGDMAETGDLFGTGYDPDTVDDLLAKMGVQELDDDDLGEFGGSYVEDYEAIQARSENTTNSKTAQGLREVILVYTQEDYELFVTTVQTLRLALKTDSTSATVLTALTGE